MRIGFIGAGKVGTTFGLYLKKHNYQVYGYYSRRIESAIKAGEITNTKGKENLKDIVDNSDILFITTNDNEISKVCDKLIEENILSEGKILVHMSGASSSKVLERAKEKNCHIYSLHPLQSFADVNKGVKDLENTVFSLEGDEEKIDVIENILKTTGNTYFKIDASQKAIYHATASVVSNYLVGLMDYGLSLFESIGIEKEDGFKALLPLIEGSIKNIENLGTAEALTGPIARGDTETVIKHINSLRKNKPEDLEVYKVMGLRTLELAKEAKLKDKDKIEELTNILKEV